ncbi:MAG: flagellar export protein FliJ [Verrucomicrobiia bacterium]|jgi:flagellar export protein FliJ
MKPFKFTLQALHTVRMREEQEKLEQYSRRVGEYQKAVKLLEEAEREMDECEKRLEKFYHRGGLADELRFLELLKESAEEKCKRRFDEVKLAQNAMEKALSEWLEAKKNRDTVEKYKQRQKARYNLELRRQEQKLLDEMKSRLGFNAVVDTEI